MLNRKITQHTAAMAQMQVRACIYIYISAYVNTYMHAVINYLHTEEVHPCICVSFFMICSRASMLRSLGHMRTHIYSYTYIHTRIHQVELNGEIETLSSKLAASKDREIRALDAQVSSSTSASVRLDVCMYA
jgi:hypothetical protein